MAMLNVDKVKIAKKISRSLREVPNGTAQEAADCIDVLLAELDANQNDHLLQVDSLVQKLNRRVDSDTEQLREHCAFLESALKHIANPYLYVVEEVQGSPMEASAIKTLIDKVTSVSHLAEVAQLALQGKPFLD